MKYKSSLKNWQNSIYTYNKNNINHIVYLKNKYIYLLLNSYFNMNNNSFKLKKNIDTFFLNSFDNIHKKSIYNLKEIYEDKFKVLSLQYSLSKRKSKLYNWKNKLILSKKLNTSIKTFFYSISLRKTLINYPLIKHTNNIVSIVLFIFNTNKIYIKTKLNKLNKFLLINNLFKIKNNINLKQYNILNDKEYINKKLNISNILYYNNIIKGFIKEKYIKLFFKRNYLTNLYINNYILNNLNLINLKNIIYKLYGKNIKLNITNLKYVYLDNSIFITSIINKLNDRKKRVLNVMKKSLKLLKIAKLNSMFLSNKKNIITNTLNITSNYLYKNILNSIKNIHIIGVSLEAKGRLTRRMTASRSVYKLKMKGSLKNIAFSLDNSPNLRGFLKPNVDYIKNSSYNKNGSYGIKIKTNTY